MKTASVTEYLLKAILELIEKCHSIEDLRESVNRIRGQRPVQSPLPKPHKVNGREPYPDRITGTSIITM